MSRQNQILGIVAIVLVIIIGAFVFWPAAVEEDAEPVATVEGGGTADTDATAPTSDEQPGAEGQTEGQAETEAQTDTGEATEGTAN